MNHISFLGTDLRNQFGEQGHISQVFTYIENELRKKDQVVCRFQINGVDLDEPAEKRLSNCHLNEIEKIDVYYQGPTQVLNEIIQNWQVQIPKMITVNDDLANKFRFQGIDGNLKSLVELIDNCQLLVESIISIDSVLAKNKFVKSESWQQAKMAMASTIGEVLAAFQKKDFTWLADILEYDLGHNLQIWSENFAKLGQSEFNIDLRSENKR